MNHIVFLNKKSENINYRSVQALSRRKMEEIIEGIGAVKHKYEKRGFESAGTLSTSLTMTVSLK